MQIKRRTIVGSLAALATFPRIATAQTQYPSKPVKIVVNNAPGGIADIVTREVTSKLAAKWSKPVIVENRPGAGGTIGAEYVARQPIDGYTLLSGGIHSHAVSPVVLKTVPYDPINDFTAISLLSTFANVLMTNPALPVNSIQEFIAMAKANPEKFAYATPGNGSSPHLAAEYFCQLAGIKLIHVPYSGSAEATRDVLGGQVPLAFDTLGVAALPYLRSGKLKALAVTSETRSPFLPDTPTFMEAGLAGYEVTSWLALYGPARLSDDIKQRISTDVQTILEDPITVKKLESLAAVAQPLSGVVLDQFLDAELKKFKQIVRSADLKFF